MAKADDTRKPRRTPRTVRKPASPLFEALVATAECAFIAVDARGAIELANPSARRMLGWSEPPAGVNHWPEQTQLFREAGTTALAPDELPLARALRGESGREERLLLCTAPGAQVRWLRASYDPLYSSTGKLRGALLWLRDASEEQRLAARIAEQQTRLDLQASLMKDVAAPTSTSERIDRALELVQDTLPCLRVAYAVVDPQMQMRELAWRQPASLTSSVGRELDLNQVPAYLVALLHRGVFRCADVEREPALEPIRQRLVEAGTRALLEVSVRHSETLRGAVAFSCREPHEWSEHELGTLTLLADYLSLALTDGHREQERQSAQSELDWLVLHDRLTGLANRVLLLDRLEQAIRRARRDPSTSYAVLFLDFDRFKIVNDGLGHALGDQLLVEIANRLRVNLRDLDTSARWSHGLLPARLGGDEFVLLLDDIAGPSEVERIVQRVQKAVSAPYQIGGQEISVGASIGVVLDNGRYERPDQVLRDADTAMYCAKAQGKSSYVVFDEEMHEAVVRRLTLECELRRAVERAEFVVHYQPIVELRTERTTGFEALLRWRHPEGRLVPPAEFIPLAEELGLIVPMGEWILAESVRQLRDWRRQFPSFTGLTVSVNLSKRQIMHPDLVGVIERLLREAELDPSALKLEITESTVIENPADAAHALKQLEALGVRLCMDDFGTGHSSLGLLQSFPIHVLKVDRSLIAALDDHREYAAITEAIVTLAHSLRMKVGAEGVEKREHVELLRELDCDEAQGFFFARPMDAEAATRMLERTARGGLLRG